MCSFPLCRFGLNGGPECSGHVQRWIAAPLYRVKSALRVSLLVEVVLLHQSLVPQVVGDNTTALDAVLECDTERLLLLEEEHRLMEELSGGASSADATSAAATANGGGGEAAEQRAQQGAAAVAAAGGDVDTLAKTERLAYIGKRLHEIGEVPAVHASIEAV